MSLSYVFFGTPEVGVQVLDGLAEAYRAPLAIVCQPDRPRGRGGEVTPQPTKLWAERRSVPAFQPATCKDQTFLRTIQELKPDLGLVFAFGQLLPKALLDIPPLGFINLHPSLLPRYRGAAPIQWALINGDEVTGVTIVKVTPRLDDGDIILQESVKVGSEENTVELSERLAGVGGKLAVRALDLLEKGGVTATPQDENLVVWAPALSKEDGRIDWTQKATAIHNRVRAMQPWPGAYGRLGEKLLKIHRTIPAVSEVTEAKPGQVVTAGGSDLVVCAGEGFLRLLEVQLEGKKRLLVRDFLLGRPIGLGEVLR